MPPVMEYDATSPQCQSSPFRCPRPSGQLKLLSYFYYLTKTLVGFDLKLEEINFHEELLSRVVKHSDIPDLIKQLELETINCIPQTSLQIKTDRRRGDRVISVVKYTSLLLPESWTLRPKIQIFAQFLDQNI
ncbi:hypothetical protein TNCV_2539221 [Trichonephila clavipes]|nr:hypothetical protein TNCV_2539221 [Trichonephila clavipes]